MRDKRRADQIEKFSHYKSLDLQNKIYQLKALSLAKKTNLPTGASILDLGCADGSFAAYAGEILNAKPFGLDLDDDTIATAKKNGVTAIAHDLSEKLPYKDKQFDLVFALEVIEHLFDTDFFLGQIHRVLKPNGFLILSTPNLASLPNRLRLMFGGYPKYLEYSTAGAGHIHLYTRQILEKQIAANGFEVRKVTSPNSICPFITKDYFPVPVRQLCVALGDILPQLNSHLIVLAQK